MDATPFLRFALAVVLAVFLTSLLPQLPDFALLFAGFGFCLWALMRRRWFVLGLVFGLLWASLWGHMLLQQRLPEFCSGQWFEVEGQVSSLVRQYDGSLPAQHFRFDVTRFMQGDTRCLQPRQLWLSAYQQQGFTAGSRWRLQARLKSPRGYNNPGGYNRLLWFASRGIDATGSVRVSSAVPLPPRLHFHSTVSVLREHVRATILSSVAHSDAAAILVALGVGDNSLIRPQLSDALRALGISHIVVISGLHIALAAGLGLFLGKLFALLGLGGARAMGLCLALVFATYYALLAGLALPCLRALIMLYVAVWFLLRDAPTPLWLPFGVALCAVLLWQPLSPLGAGFWLSFGAVAALLALARRYRYLSAWRLALLMQAFLAVLMSVLSLCFFDGLSPVMLLTNAVFVPLASLFVVPAVLLAALASLANSPLAPALWRFLGDGLGAVIELLSRTSQELPNPWVELSPGVIALTVAVLAGALLLLPPFRGLRGIAVVLLLPLVLPRGSNVPAGAVDIWVLDVGQGTAVLVHSAEHSLLYDTGGGSDTFTIAESVLLSVLRRLGIKQLDTLVISHADNDHSAGAMWLKQRYPNLQSISSDPRFGETSCVAGMSIDWPLEAGRVLEAQFLAPFSATERRLSNDSSCVLQLRIGSHRVLLPGDIEAARERELVRVYAAELAADVLLLAHHGSNTSSTHAWLKHVRPRLGIASAGHANRFSHPHPRVLERLAQHGVTVLNTAHDGAILLRFYPDDSMVIKRWRYANWRYWY